MLETLSRETLTLPQDAAVVVVPDAAHRVIVRRTRAPQPALRGGSAAWAAEHGPRFEAMPPGRALVEPPRAEPTAAPLRITRRGRAVLVATVVALIFIAFSVGRVVSNAAPSGAVHPTTHTVVVAPGDTAWSIAREAMPTLDGRDAVDRLLALNHSDGRLQVGQTLLVPGS